MTTAPTLTPKKHPEALGWLPTALLVASGLAALVALGRCAVEPGAVVLAEEKTAASAAVQEGA